MKKVGWKKSLLDFWNLMLILLSIMVAVKEIVTYAFENQEKIKNFD